MSDRDRPRPPSVDRLARDPRLDGFPEVTRVEAARAAVQAAAGATASLDELVEDARRRASELSAPSLRPAVNMSGVVLHTGLGRARLAPSVAAHVAAVLDGHATVEFDLETGGRGDRQAHAEGLLRRLTGAEAALVVNNCAAAVYLALAAHGAGREVVLSRGQMVEIGGSYRMPDIVRQTGCRLVEVGCTNKTRLSDYETALTAETAVLLRCHPSNFRIVGFTGEPSARELAGLARDRGLLLLDDVGSGCLVDTARYGLPRERTLAESLTDGADLVMASGDKLLGGPQAGLLLGRSDLVAACKRHPLARAFRVDKATLAALEATLRLYAEGREEELPVWRYAARPLAEVNRLAHTLKRAWPGAWVADGLTEMGGGSMPGRGLPTRRTAIPAESADELLSRLRRHETPVVGRIEQGVVWLDPRTAEPAEVRSVAALLRRWAENR